MKRAIHKIVFDREDDATACAMAELGQSHKQIMRKVPLTKCQVAYRSHKLAKMVYRYPKGVGLSTAWRNGFSRAWKEWGPQLVAIAKKRIQEEAPPKLVHPTTKLSGEK